MEDDILENIYVGTSGYDYTEWKGVLYPEGMKREDFLTYYAQEFNALELNFSYYRIPSEKQISSMVKRTEGKVKFSIKGTQDFTHTVDSPGWKESVKEYRKAIEPMINDDLLLSVLLQFPQSFHHEVAERKYLDQLIGEFGETPLIVESRHRSWNKESVYKGLDSRGVGYCITDMPSLKHLPEFTPVVTGKTAYLRFHGRNDKNWYGTDARKRYEYLYSDQELEGILPIFMTILNHTQLVQIYFNNHAKGNAVVNARKIKMLLSF